MSYGVARRGMGDVMDAVTFTAGVATDPYLSQVIGLIEQINDLPSMGGVTTPTVGVGLNRLITPLQIYISVRKNPWTLPALAFGVTASIFALGMIAGKNSKKTPSSSGGSGSTP